MRELTVNNGQIETLIITNDHAFEKHVFKKGEFRGFIKTKKQFQDHIESVMRNPDDVANLPRDRIMYWHEETRTLVIHNKKIGTAYQPKDSYAEFEKIKQSAE